MYTYCVLPETKGKTLQEIQKMLAGRGGGRVRGGQAVIDSSAPRRIVGGDEGRMEGAMVVGVMPSRRGGSLDTADIVSADCIELGSL